MGHAWTSGLTVGYHTSLFALGHPERKEEKRIHTYCQFYFASDSVIVASSQLSAAASTSCSNSNPPSSEWALVSRMVYGLLLFTFTHS